MLAIVGTVPDRKFDLVEGPVDLKDDYFIVQGKAVRVNRGTPALVAAAAKSCEVLALPPPIVFLAGDIGLGNGSRRLYEYLTRHIKGRELGVVTFHYLQPDVDWHNRVLFAIEDMKTRPVLIADAGFMYAAKMSGQSAAYDLFTPDIGELAFLADESAPHPFYTRGFILHEKNRTPELIARAYEHENAASRLLVKGKQDHVADAGGIRASVDCYPEEAMEAIGGTGDTLTGIVSALPFNGLDPVDAAVLAARANRLAGHCAHPTPATQVTEIIRQIPGALEDLLEGTGEPCEQRCAF